MQAEGFDSGMTLNILPKQQWYKADGTPVSGLLPADDYHYARFKAKGWTLIPPAAQADPLPDVSTAFLDEITPEEPVEETE